MLYQYGTHHNFPLTRKFLTFLRIKKCKHSALLKVHKQLIAVDRHIDTIVLAGTTQCTIFLNILHCVVPAKMIKVTACSMVFFSTAVYFQQVFDG